MILRVGSTVCFALGLLASTALAQPPACRSSDPVTELVRSVVRDWKRNNCWPEPFVNPDRQNVRAPFVLMVNNGWRRQNLLSADHFQAEGGALNLAGQEKLRWILTEAPEHHRMVYVSRGYTPEETASRMATVQKSAAKMVLDGQIPPIIETSISPPTWPAERVDGISRKFQDTAPPPRLPAAERSDQAK